MAEKVLRPAGPVAGGRWPRLRFALLRAQGRDRCAGRGLALRRLRAARDHLPPRHPPEERHPAHGHAEGSRFP